MPEYLAPGVYIEEVPSGNKPIQAASTSTAAMVGMTARGPVNRPTLVTSRGGLNRIFGWDLNPLAFTNGRDSLPYAAEGFFTNGGTRLYVVRIVGDAATESELRIMARDTRVNASPVLAAPASEGDTTLLLGRIGVVAVDDQLLIEDGENSEPVTIADAAFVPRLQIDGGLRHAYAAADAVTLQTVTAIAETLAGAASAGDAELQMSSVGALAAGNVVLLSPAAGDAEGRPEVATIASVDGGANTITLTAPLTRDHAITAVLSTLSASGTAPTLNAAAGPSAVRVILDLDPAGISAGDVVRLDNGTDGEFAFVSDVPAIVTITEALEGNHAAGVSVTPAVPVLTAHARYPGVWGDSLRITASPSSLVSTTSTAVAPAAANTISVTTAFGLFPGSVVVIDSRLTREVAAVNAIDGIVTLTATHDEELAEGVAVVSQEFSLMVERMADGRAAESEVFDRLSLASEHPRYALTIVGRWDTASDTPSESGASALIRLADDADGATRVMPLIHRVGRLLDGGNDDVGGVGDDDYIGVAAQDPGARTGIQALENEPTISIVAAPGQTSVSVQKALIAHCEKMRYRFAVLDTPIGSNLEQARTHRQNYDNTRAAIYYPSLEIADRFGEPGDRRIIPPSGHILGVYARTDIARGVHKAPANEVVRGILSFDTKLSKGEQDILNPINLNCLRDFRTENRGLRVYGARVATSDPEWRYVNVRRLLLFIEQSLDTGLQWAVFELNDKPLWDTVKQSITNFLTTVWRSGALEGSNAEEAFFVNIGYDITMTQDDIDNGRMIVEIGVAPVKPAEFVIVRISQKTREATS